MFNRKFNEARKQQGFKSQAHLNSFYRYFDHTKACPDCQTYEQVWLNDGPQPVRIDCPAALKLFRDRCKY